MNSPRPSLASDVTLGVTDAPTPERGAILLTIAYDGSAFSGLARQSNATTIAGLLEAAIWQMDPDASGLRVASRTDAGVHAERQYVAFDTSARITCRGWLMGITGAIPPQIAILRAARVAPGFQPSRRALHKTYRYRILCGTLRDPFLHERAWRVWDRLNQDAMRAEALDLIGTHDFRAFRGAADPREYTVRDIHTAKVAASTEEPRALWVEISGNRFLYNMVRIIVGTLVDVGRGKLEPGAVKRALVSGSRDDLGMTAPARGLYLRHIELDETGSDPWPAE